VSEHSRPAVLHWQINVMGSINRPFVSTDRIEVTYTNRSWRHIFELNIHGLHVF